MRPCATKKLPCSPGSSCPPSRYTALIISDIIDGNFTTFASEASSSNVTRIQKIPGFDSDIARISPRDRKLAAIFPDILPQLDLATSGSDFASVDNYQNYLADDVRQGEG